jgi:hypothetical protein
MPTNQTSDPRHAVPWVAAGMGTALIAFHLIVNRQYGFHGDELYFIVCGMRPDWGYADHPPFVPMVARISTALFGVNLFALRLFPALVLGAGCVLTGWLARRLGAGTFGEFLAALSFVCAPMMIRVGAFLNIPCFEVLFWLVAAHLVVTLVHREDPRWWIAVGALAGVSLLNKHTTLFLGTGLAVGLLITGRRRDLATLWPWIGGLLAFLIFLPNLWWQYQNDWATLEFVRKINESAMGSRVEFILGQIILMNCMNAVVFLAGLLFYFACQSGRPYRLLGWVFLTVLVILLVLRAKVYYLLPAYPLLMAGGAVWIEARSGRRWRAARALLATGIAAVGLLFVPIMSPVGTLEWKEAYIARVLGVVLDDPKDLTFDFHYQIGRPEELEALKQVVDALPAEERASAVILADEYDSASAVNVLGRSMGLPQAISGNNSYYRWGPRGATGECVVALGYGEEALRGWFGEVEVAGHTPDGPIYVCRHPRARLDVMWAEFKAYF